MAGPISGLDPLTSAIRANYALAIESLTDPLEDTKRFPLSSVVGTKVVVVNSESDFPDPVSTVITASDNTAYIISDQFSMSNSIVLGSGTVLFGYGPRVSKLTYTGTGTFLTLTDATLTINRMGFDCPNGTFLDADSSGLANQFITIESSRLDSCVKLGNLDDISLSVMNFASISHDDGFSLSGTIPFVIVSGLSSIDSGAGSIGLDLGTAVVTNFQMRRSTFAGAGTAVSGAASSANIPSGRVGTFDDVSFTNIATPLSGIARDDIRWEFQSCDGVLHSFKAAEATLIVSREVTIASSGVYVVVNGTDWVDKVSDRFSISTDGLITYLGEVDATFHITAFATVQLSGGGSNELCMRLALNGTTIEDSEACTQNSTPTSIPCQTVLTLSNGDEINTYVANNTGTTNIDVDKSNITVIEV